mmetsp:Transcript_31143/g.78166  ORF Transcript_31143/g.78166 Transcript_31143/m.78166 type:complete len:186 (-) Transcript_31143:352-909(-)|eukprot:CAMPEP_0177630360 /NCGR_PEP_ID=MMETSP0447-20121125/1170_1 /TAXON_ID=0 /ORGANISM="Stygamoeba regulata, Strain BSH-02190019" /LENGTH=185 /DNA_ID=CAMNT_0019131763 /DNA_START=64 /DNA_END=621 /DNA_ORIENTATION=+
MEGFDESQIESQFALRPLLLADIPGLRKLQNESFPIEYTSKYYEGLFEGPHVNLVIVHRNTGQVLGGLTTRIEQSGSSLFGLFRVEKTAYIMTICVDKSCKRKGFASRMLELMLDSLRSQGCLSVSLHVLTTNTAALSLYEKYGFSKRGLVRGHYFINGLHRDAVFMEHVFSHRNNSLWRVFSCQ